MRFALIFPVLALMLVPLAGCGWGKYIWGPPTSRTAHAYLEGAKLPQMLQWADDDFKAEDWIAARGGNSLAVVNGFYEAGMITDQYFDDDVPVLEVGRAFIELSHQDQWRVVTFMDEVFGITASHPDGVILIYFDPGRIPVGLYTAKGLQLQ